MKKKYSLVVAALALSACKAKVDTSSPAPVYSKAVFVEADKSISQGFDRCQALENGLRLQKIDSAEVSKSLGGPARIVPGLILTFEKNVKYFMELSSGYTSTGLNAPMSREETEIQKKGIQDAANRLSEIKVRCYQSSRYSKIHDPFKPAVFLSTRITDAGGDRTTGEQSDIQGEISIAQFL